MTDWRELRAAAHVANADVIQSALDALAELEACQADDAQMVEQLVPFVGFLKSRARDQIRAADQLDPVNHGRPA